MTHKVFVYGTLLTGFYNHERVFDDTDARLVCDAETADAVYTMVDLGHFPGVIVGGCQKIVGELYAVGDDTMRALDRLEGFPRLYTRVQVPLSNGQRAWMYIYNTDPGENPCSHRVIPSGNYRAHQYRAHQKGR